MSNSILDRLRRRTTVDANGCWVWTGAIQSKGYGQIRFQGKTVYVHRLSYELFVGPIPEGKQIDHACRVRTCWRPDHLEAVTPKENTRRGLMGELQTHCKRGHEFTPENMYEPTALHPRRCKLCTRERHRRLYAERANP